VPPHYWETAMSSFRIAYKLETAPPAADEHEPPLISQEIGVERDQISPRLRDVVGCRAATARMENGRYRSAGSVRYCWLDWSVGRNIRSRSHNSADRTVFLDHGFRA
jgi:hypothetical protein